MQQLNSAYVLHPQKLWRQEFQARPLNWHAASCQSASSARASCASMLSTSTILWMAWGGNLMASLGTRPGCTVAYLMVAQSRTAAPVSCRSTCTQAQKGWVEGHEGLQMWYLWLRKHERVPMYREWGCVAVLGSGLHWLSRVRWNSYKTQTGDSTVESGRRCYTMRQGPIHM
jgi:hypothetical protein